jgi:DNA-binding transcriptional ArsR family regulator
VGDAGDVRCRVLETGILIEVSQRTPTEHLSREGRSTFCKHLEKAGLSCAVPSYEPYLVACLQ